MVPDTLLRKSSARQSLDAASHSAHGSDGAPRRKENKLTELRSALARAHAKKHSLVEQKEQLIEYSVDQAIEYEQLRDALAKVKPHCTSEFSLDRRSLDKIMNLCVDITGRARTEEANLRDELAAERAALAEAESVRDSAVEERNRLARAADTKAREVNDTRVSLQQEVELLRLQCVEREHECREQIEFVTREARINVSTADELCEAAQQEVRENESVHKDLQTELEQVTAEMQARIDELEENREQGHLASARLEENAMGRYELEQRIGQLEHEKAEVLETLLDEIEQLRASNDSCKAQSWDSCSRCAEVAAQLEETTMEGEKTKQEVEFVRRLHVDAVSQATAIQAEMEATLLQLREENADLRRQVARTRLECIREEESPRS
eukprot:GEMP01051535.1.p1 GENE.GEMP01051535.1~~GEMP01051535.1.p1  ORF type:complete len:413 (+),score=126.91 GEMP01051535.1:91-1239(+)